MSGRQAQPPPSQPDVRQDDDYHNNVNETSNNSTSSSVPLASANDTPKGGNQRFNKSPPQHPKTMKTIQSSATGSDQRPMQRPPANHGFINSLYDSDGSDGSIVFNQPKSKPPSTSTQERKKGRERFPSFDSMASSGSLVRHVSPQQKPQQPKQTPQNLARMNPQMLPYDQRRKLMQMRQKQKQQSQRDRSPPQPNRMDPRFNNPYMMQHPPGDFHHPPPQQQQQYPVNGMGVPPPQHYPYPMQGQPMPMQHGQPMQLPFGAYPTPPNARLSPYRGAPPSPYRYDPNRPQPIPSKQGMRSYPPQQNIPQRPPQQQAPPQQKSLPSRTASQPARDKLMQSSSLDSSDQDAAGRNTRGIAAPLSTHTDPSSGSNNPPPPPPPPPPVPPHHVRAESSGSVSSLGSQGSIFGYIAGHDDDNAKNQTGQGKSDFLQMLNPFSSKTQQSSPQEAAEDFRRKSEDFLKKSAAQRQPRKPAPPPKHHRVGSFDRPPATRGSHQRLPSIDNDNWEESSREKLRIERTSSQISSGEESGEAGLRRPPHQDDDLNERTSLLPPPGQGSSEHMETRRRSAQGESRQSYRRHKQKKRANRNRESEAASSNNPQSRRSSQRKKKRSRRRTRRSRNEGAEATGSSDDSESSSSSSYDYRQWTKRRSQLLEEERNRLIAQWKAEARAEALNSNLVADDSWHKRTGQYFDSECGAFFGKVLNVLYFLEAFICNLPLTVGAIAMSIVTLGVVWFKFVEEILPGCEPVQFHSSQCTFPEFPGCFYCDTTAPMYKIAVNFHFACSAFAGVLALSFVLKLLLASQAFLDELSSPTTASPAGLICMTTCCVFAGRGIVGQVLVSLASCVHLCLVIWFIYMALAYRIMPEPSWFPNTVGIGMSAVKTWLYYPMSGHFLMAISLSLNFFFFPISLIRVALNEKISAPVAYMQMSAPAVSLYALTIMAQPSFEQEKPDINRFQRAHRLVYLPAMHVLFCLSIVGMVSSIQALAVRWKHFRKREFSGAYAAFPFPTLLHANAIQAYRAAINSFSSEPINPVLSNLLFAYWVLALVGGTIVTVYTTFLFFWNLPAWTNIDIGDEDEPPAPYETTMTLQNVIATGEALVQPFVSPAVLQANETGALVMVRRHRNDGGQQFVRTRKVTALGFEPIMSWSEMERERDLLLEWTSKHPRRQSKSMSVPGIDFNSYAEDVDLGVGNSGVYGSMAPGGVRPPNDIVVVPVPSTITGMPPDVVPSSSGGILTRSSFEEGESYL